MEHPMQSYYDSLNQPWGKLLYQVIWHNIECDEKRILDFGSGFGLTANYLAANNEVVAIEPNEEMVTHRSCENTYVQMVGGIEKLSLLEDKSFDMIVCHNVLEYMNNRSELLQIFGRLLKKDGLISIVKHNRMGKIMQKAVLEYKIDEAIELIKGDKYYLVEMI